MSAPRDFAGWLADGRQAIPRQVRVTPAATALLLAGDAEGAPEIWPYAALRLVADETRRGPLRIAFGDQRLSVDDPAFSDALFAAAPLLRRQRRRGLMLAALAAASAMLAGLVLWWAFPLLIDTAIAWIPPEWETKLGKEVSSILADTRCVAEPGSRALDQLARRLGAGTAMSARLAVTVAASEIPNAFALPGGRIVVMRGLLREMGSPDELAGVLAHEMAHELKRHPLRRLIAGAGASAVFELLFGNGTGSTLGSTVFALSYSRRAEAEADAGAVELLRAAGIGTGGLADLLERLSRHHGLDLPPFLRSHPAPQQRVAALRAAGSADARPALTEAEWQALTHVCDRIAKLPP